MKNTIKIIFIVIIALVVFNYRGEIGSYFSDNSAADTEDASDWGGLRERALRSYKYEDPEIAVDHLLEYEKVVQTEYKAVVNNTEDPRVRIKLSCELGWIYMKLAEKYLQLANETLYYEYLEKGREHLKDCSEEVDSQNT